MEERPAFTYPLSLAALPLSLDGKGGLFYLAHLYSEVPHDYFSVVPTTNRDQVLNTIN